MSAAFTYADLFAGIGGFAAALNDVGGRHAYAVEIDPYAAKVYRDNFGVDSYGDITKDVNDDQVAVPDHDVLTAGFPCQPFSKSGAQKGMDEVRGTLFFHIEKTIRACKPTLVVLENVRNLAGPRHIHEWEVIIEHLRSAGYQVSHEAAVFSPHQIDPAYGGAPQVRERVFITATRVPTRADGASRDMVADPAVEPVRLPESIRMTREWDLAEDLPLDADRNIPGTELSSNEIRWITVWDEMVQALRELRARDADIAGEPARPLPGFPIWVDAWTTRTEHELQMVGAPAWKQNFLRKNFELFQALRERGDRAWLSRWLRKVREFPESRRKLEWQAQDAQSMWDCVISLRPSGLRVKRPTHLPALVAITQTPIIGPLRRRLSPTEAARLQGLGHLDFGTQRDALTYKQLGNGVNVGVVKQVLRAHVERDKALLAETAAGRAIYNAVATAVDNGHTAELLAEPLETSDSVDERVELLVGDRA